MIPFALQHGGLGRGGFTGYMSTLVDNFSTNTIANYGQTADTSTTWTISGGGISVSGGLQSLLYHSAVSTVNARVSVTTGNAYDAGLALRVNGNTHYLLAISSEAYTPSPQVARIYKRISGTYTDLTGAISITWPSGITKLVEFEAQGSSLRAYLEGALIASISDGSISAAGYCAMRHAGSGAFTNNFDNFTIRY